ncbi:MAG: hypothetical protein RLZZ153_242 [Pseudomonadota bacterium]
MGDLMKKHKFVICTPPYANNSAGIIILHELCDALVKNGHEAYVALMHMSEGQWDFHYPVSEEGFHPGLQRTVVDPVEYERAVNDALDNGICIYPEIVQGNPLMAKRVARYFLYYDGGISGVKSDYSVSDYLIAFNPIYIENPNAILFKPPIDSAMSDEGAPAFGSRTLDLTFFGKGPKYTDCFLVGGTVELSKAWPRTKAELAALLRSTRYLYTWDCHSAVNMDAMFCGARPVLMQSKQLEIDVVPVDQSYMSLMIPIESIEDGSFDAAVDGYESRRAAFVADMKGQVDRWVSNVRGTVDGMVAFFRL